MFSESIRRNKQCPNAFNVPNDASCSKFKEQEEKLKKNIETYSITASHGNFQSLPGRNSTFSPCAFSSVKERRLLSARIDVVFIVNIAKRATAIMQPALDKILQMLG